MAVDGLHTGVDVEINLYEDGGMAWSAKGEGRAKSVAIVFIAVPSFWVATLVVLYPAIWWGWSPSPELVRFRDGPLGNLGMFVVPEFILAMARADPSGNLREVDRFEGLRFGNRTRAAAFQSTYSLES